MVKFDNDAGNTAVANQQVGTAADQADRNIARFMAQKVDQIVGIFGMYVISASPPTQKPCMAGGQTGYCEDSGRVLPATC